MVRLVLVVLLLLLLLPTTAALTMGTMILLITLTTTLMIPSCFFFGRYVCCCCVLCVVMLGFYFIFYAFETKQRGREKRIQFEGDDTVRTVEQKIIKVTSNSLRPPNIQTIESIGGGDYFVHYFSFFLLQKLFRMSKKSKF